MSRKAAKISNSLHKGRNSPGSIKGSIRGSITVEASFILPLVILVTFALIYLSFCLHDLCRIRGVVDQTIHKAGLTCKHEVSLETGDIRYESVNNRGIFYMVAGDTEQEEKAMNYHILSKLSRGLLLSRIIAVESEVGKFSLSVSVRAKTSVNLPVFGKLFDNYSETRITGSYAVHNPAETLRACETILHTGSKIKGSDELMNRLQKLLP